MNWADAKANAVCPDGNDKLFDWSGLSSFAKCFVGNTTAEASNNDVP
jgi:hypothetical protein